MAQDHGKVLTLKRAHENSVVLSGFPKRIAQIGVVSHGTGILVFAIKPESKKPLPKRKKKIRPGGGDFSSTNLCSASS